MIRRREYPPRWQDEQRELITLKSKEIKQENNNIQRRNKRRNKEGLTSREQKKQETIKVIKELKGQGLSQSKVSKESGYSIALVKRYWNI